jgi:hypothetical protein
VFHPSTEPVQVEPPRRRVATSLGVPIILRHHPFFYVQFVAAFVVLPFPSPLKNMSFSRIDQLA